jgi:hypothetical protein
MHTPYDSPTEARKDEINKVAIICIFGRKLSLHFQILIAKIS